MEESLIVPPRDLTIDGQVDDGLTPDGSEQWDFFFECLFARWAVGLLVARTSCREGAQHGGLEGFTVLDAAHQGVQPAGARRWVTRIAPEGATTSMVGDDKRCRMSNVVPLSPGGTE